MEEGAEPRRRGEDFKGKGTLACFILLVTYYTVFPVTCALMDDLFA